MDAKLSNCGGKMKNINGLPLYLLLLPINLIVAFIAVILSPILPLFASEDGWLPTWLWWFQTPDAPIDGDSGWKDLYKHPYVNKLSRYLRRVLWLCRNPSYGFNWTILASKPLPKEWTYEGDLDCDNSVLSNTRKVTKITVFCGEYFHKRYYRKIGSTNRCFQLNYGWNMHALCKNGKQEGVKAKYRFTPKLGKIN